MHALKLWPLQLRVHGLRLLLDLNWDRLLYVGTILAALLIGGFLGSLVTTGF